QLPKLIPVHGAQSDRRLEALLPSPVEEEPLLRAEAQVALFPLPVLQDAELLEQLAHVGRARPRHRHVVRGPWVLRDLVFTPPRVAARLPLHLEQDEVREAAAI